MRSPSSPARLVSRILAGATDIREGEGRGVLAAGLLFFLILTAIMILRPVREALGLQSGIEQVRLLFLATMGLLLLLVPAFGLLVARLPRRGFLAVSFRLSAALLLGFAILLTVLPEQGCRVCGAVYYVFHSAFNLFLVGLFWALMADLYGVAQSKRLFPAIAVGGTLGAVAGSMLAGHLAGRIPLAGFFVIAAATLEAAVRSSALAARWCASDAAASRPSRPIGGNVLAGIITVARSRYVLGIGVFIFLTGVISTFLYFTELRIVASQAESVSHRTALFANINFWTQFATLLAQAFIAGRIMQHVGVGTALAALPACSAVGFAFLAGRPTLAAYTLVNALTKAVQRGITRPARETLFTVVSREDKYKAKSFVDTFFFRAGDAGSAQLERTLAATGLGVAGLTLAVLPIAVIWIVLAVMLGKAQSRRSFEPAATEMAAE